MGEKSTRTLETSLAVGWVAARLVMGVVLLISVALYLTDAPAKFQASTERIGQLAVQTMDEVKPLFDVFDEKEPDLSIAATKLATFEQFVKDNPSVVGLRLINAGHSIIAATRDGDKYERPSFMESERKFWRELDLLVRSNIENQDFITEVLVSVVVSQPKNSELAEIHGNIEQTIYESGNYSWYSRAFLFPLSVAMKLM